MSPRVESFLAALAEPARSAWSADEDVATWVAERLASARSAWPEIAIDDDRFLRFLASKSEKVGAGLSAVHSDDLYLACACLDGDPKAIACFEERHVPQIQRVLARANLDGAAVDDLTASLREQLLYGRERAPILADYTGRGPIGGWLRSVAVHLAFKLKKREGRHVEADDANVLGDSEDNPEVELFRRRHAEAFEQALARALQSLAPRERNLLRQHYLDALNVDALGKLYRVHRATVARWIAAAREVVLDAVKADLADRMTASEIESMIKQPQKELALSFSRILKVTPRP